MAPGIQKEDCAAHCINTVVRGTFTVPFYELRQRAHEACSLDVVELFDTCHEAVRTVKAAPKNLAVPTGFNLDGLKKSLHLSQPHMRSCYAQMVQSLRANRYKVLTVLKAIGRQDIARKLENLDDNMAANLTGFLSPLERNGNVPAGDLESLKRHLTINTDDCFNVKAMKIALKDLHALMDVLLLVKLAKEIVTYLKATGLASHLSKKVLQEVDTRWNSLHTMLESVREMYDEIVAVLAEHGGSQAPKVNNIDRGMLGQLTRFLQEFKEETKTLEGNNIRHRAAQRASSDARCYAAPPPRGASELARCAALIRHPTLPCVLLAATTLRDHCQPAPEDRPQLLAVKRRCFSLLGEKFQPSMKAKMATFLWPDFKELTMLPEAEKAEVIARVRGLIEEPAAEQVPDDPGAPPAPKVSKFDKYRKYRHADSGSGDPPPADEISRYQAMCSRPDGLPKLAKLAKQELGKLATAAPSERIWSKTGFLLNNRRNRLTPKRLNSIVVLNSCLRKQYKAL
ncbi:Transposable element Hobo transposase, partial [Frankliniella fusca]